MNALVYLSESELNRHVNIATVCLTTTLNMFLPQVSNFLGLLWWTDSVDTATAIATTAIQRLTFAVDSTFV